MRAWGPDQVAEAAQARMVVPGSTQSGPERVVIDSRQAGPGALFVGLRGENVDGGRFAGQALEYGAWVVLVLMLGGDIPGATRTLSIVLYNQVENFDYAAANRTAALLLGLSVVALGAIYLGARPRGGRRA